MESLKKKTKNKESKTSHQLISVFTAVLRHPCPYPPIHAERSISVWLYGLFMLRRPRNPVIKEMSLEQRSYCSCMCSLYDDKHGTF